MSNPVENLQKARSALVNDRRRFASILAGTHPRGTTEEATDGIIQLQKAIEAIDAAIADEKALVPFGEIEDDPSI